MKNPSRASKASPGSWSGVFWSRAIPVPPLHYPGVLVGRSDSGKVAPVGRAGCQWLTGEFEGCLGAFPKGQFGCLAGAGAGVTPINLQV